MREVKPEDQLLNHLNTDCMRNIFLQTIERAVKFFIPAVLLMTAVGGKAQNNAARPNILIIMTDQQSAAMLSCTGNPWLKTPAMDQLAAQGVRFEKAYVTNPVCLPSRFSIQSGLYPSAAGIRYNDTKTMKPRTDVIEAAYSRSLGATFRNAGYDTYYGGKLHVPLENRNPRIWGYQLVTADDRDGLSNDVTNFLKNRKAGDKPFLFFASFINPHDICFDAIMAGAPESDDAKAAPPDIFEVLKIPAGISEKDFFDKYCPPLPANHQPMKDEPASIDSLIRDRSFMKVVRDKWTDKDWRMHRWAYARLVEKVDAQIGKVMAALKQSGLEENTIVIFTSDHGDNDASHKLEHKTFFYEESARIPFIVSYPRLIKKAAVDKDHLVSNGLDILPTLCDLAGIAAPSGLPGKSIAPLLSTKPVTAWRKNLIIENHLGFLIHTGRYKYQLDEKSVKGIREVFTDLQADPGETRNMIHDAAYQKIIRDLRKELTDYLVQSGIPYDSPTVQSR
jgi:arylsulfatase A-like enzyme